jgi:hypothetical protein
VGTGGSTRGAGGAATTVTVDIGGGAVTVTVFVRGDAVGVAGSPPEPTLPRNPNPTSPPTKLPTMMNTRFLNGDLGGGDPHSRPFQYARRAVPVGSGYQPGVRDGCEIKDSPG